jgi:hypothetical protein
LPVHVLSSHSANLGCSRRWEDVGGGGGSKNAAACASSASSSSSSSAAGLLSATRFAAAEIVLTGVAGAVTLDEPLSSAAHYAEAVRRLGPLGRKYEELTLALWAACSPPSDVSPPAYLRGDNAPAAAVLLSGPSGVGKTSAVYAVANALGATVVPLDREVGVTCPNPCPCACACGVFACPREVQRGPWHHCIVTPSLSPHLDALLFFIALCDAQSMSLCDDTSPALI